MNAFFYPSKRGINFAKIRGFKVTDYKVQRMAARRNCELANPAQVRQIASQTGVLLSAG